MWSSHNATIGVNLYGCRVDKYYRQRCRKCIDHLWAIPEFTVDQFKEAIDRVMKIYWMRKRQHDDNDDTVNDDGNKKYPRKPHEPSLCEKCKNLGRPCWEY